MDLLDTMLQFQVKPGMIFIIVFPIGSPAGYSHRQRERGFFGPQEAEGIGEGSTCWRCKHLTHLSPVLDYQVVVFVTGHRH